MWGEYVYISEYSIKQEVVCFDEFGDTEIDIYSNIIKNINSTIIFDFDHVEIKSFEASDYASGNVFIKGVLPFYDKGSFNDKEISLITNNFNIKSNNI